jgi:E3 ubiquitin-protein ligase RNF5
MAANVMESTSGSSVACDGGGRFKCNTCFKLLHEPIITLCDHLFCWSCLYKWLHIHSIKGPNAVVKYLLVYFFTFVFQLVFHFNLLS